MQEANIEELEKKIGCGQIEEVIEQVLKTLRHTHMKIPNPRFYCILYAA